MSSDKLEKLKKLQALRKGKTVEDSDSDGDYDKIYDEIDEKEYRNRKRQELLRDDFVVDDDGVGYVDRGVEEDWGNRSEYSSDEEMENKAGRKKGNNVQPAKNQIGDMLKAHHSKVILSGKQLNNQKKQIKIDDFDDILDEFDVTEDVKPIVTRKRAPMGLSSSPTVKTAMKRAVDGSSSPDQGFKKQKFDRMSMNSSPLKNQIKQHNELHNDEINDDLPTSPTKDSNYIPQDSSLLNALKTEKDDDKSLDMDGESEDDDDIVVTKRKMRTATTSRKINLDSKSSASSTPFVTAPGTPIVEKKLVGTSSQATSSGPLSFSQQKVTKEQIVDPTTGTFKMYWLDFAEVNNTLVLFGKIRLLDGNNVSAMLQIDGMYRELFFLPREGKTPTEIHEEIIPLLMEKYGLDNIRAKPEHMKYAFELPGIPHEADYLKILLPYNTPKNSRDLIPPDLSSETFHHVFGGNANIFESFVVQNKIMGPCWLEIKDGDFNALQNASHCAVEVAVNRPQNVKPIDMKDMPELNCTSIAIQTVMNPKQNKQEIVSITLGTYKGLNLDSPIPEDLQPNDIVTLVRPPQGTSFPPGLSTLAKQKMGGQVRLFNNEKTLLACLCAMIKVIDPDVLIGHRLEGVYLDVLVHRLHEFNIPTFSTIGRRVRKSWPDKFGKTNSGLTHLFIKDIMSGRLICDIGNEMGQSLTPKCQNWDLAEMYQVTCQRDHKPLEINYQNPQYQEDVNLMTMALQENATNCKIAAEVSFRIQMLSLTKQLTNLAGNAWSQTLGGTRAGRNEYILLHEFSRNGYIVPDKETQKMRIQRMKNNDGNDENETNSSSKKSKYQGGLVFEPEKGLHTNYVLVMDFNSLYPSIIQEFNICFTTVERDVENSDELPEVPSSDMAQGVLPRLLANLVERRREVKKIMKTESDPHKRIQCDIRQQALKLTANSMYGCLGYVNSRFYARPLAMLVTNKGREILMNTRQLAESMNLVVVYGDTDSVMIDTGCDNYHDAIKIGQNFKTLVNERYKLLEIDIDNVFKKLLLHAKKKYAALNVSLNKEGREETVLEVKGLDMKRREFCPLSRDISIHVLNTILSDKDPETALQEVYYYLEDMREKIEKNEIRIDKYKINTKLSKDPSAYPGGKNMPAVQVALRMRKTGRMVKAGTVITFVITKQEENEDGETTGAPSVAERAYALHEVMMKGNNLKPDPEYYLEKQIFAPVERLLERIDSFDTVRLISALGLDSKKYLRHGGPDGHGNMIEGLQPLETTISDMERFKDSSSLVFNCPNCSQKFPYGGIVASNYYQHCFNGLQCKMCQHIFTPLAMTCQVERAIRSHISLYYAGWLQCDDATCGNVTRQLSVFGKRCLNEGCTGVMHYKYTDKQLYNQLLFFDSLFNCEKIKKQELKPLYLEGDKDFPAERLSETSINALTEQNRELLEMNRAIVQKYLSDCGRRYVDMATIFEFMN